MKTIRILCLGLSALLLGGCAQNAPSEPSSSDSEASTTIQVVVSFDAMAEFVKAVGGDRVEISQIIPTGTEVHDFEPKARDLEGLSGADLFVYNGLGVESWAEEALEAVDNPALEVVIASDGVETISTSEEDSEEEEEEDHDHGNYDPHTWLSLSAAQISAENIYHALAKIDPENASYYRENCDAFQKEAQTLLETYQVKLASYGGDSIIVSHAAFGYLCRDFSLVQKSVRNIYAEGEPTAKQLAELVEYCKNNEISVIFSEEAASTAVSQTLASEVGASVEVLYTMETNPESLSYLERMSVNLEKILASFTH